MPARCSQRPAGNPLCAALAEDSVPGRSAFSTRDEPWIPCADGDYARSYAPSLSTAPRPSWHVTVAAYLWTTDLSGTSYTDGEASDFDIAFSDLFDQLESAFKGYAEVDHDRWSLAIDATYHGQVLGFGYRF